MKNKKSATIIDMYKSYKKQYDNNVDYVTFKTILDKCNEYILNEIFNNSRIIKLPQGLGSIGIVKYKPKSMTPKSLSVDYKSSAEYGKKIYHLNEHSNGYKFRFYWSKIPRTFSHRYMYQLSLVRANKRKLAQLIFNKHDYIDVNDIQIYKM